MATDTTQRSTQGRAGGIGQAAPRSFIDTLHRVSQVMNQRFAVGVGQDGLTPRQHAVLKSILARDGRSQTEISDATGIDRATTAEVVGRLAKAGYLKRRRTRRDARTYAVSITEEGRAALARTVDIASRVESEALGALSADERDQLLVLLDRLIASNALNGTIPAP